MNERSSPEASLLEQAALYAIDALPADEAARFRALARETPEIAHLVAEYEAAGSLFAEIVPPVTPPSELRGRILTAIATSADPMEAAPTAPRHSAAVFVPWGVAAALAVSLGCLWLENQQLTQDKSSLRNRIAQLSGVQKKLDVLRETAAAQDREAASLRGQIADLARRKTLAETQVATLTSKLDASYLASIAWDNDAQEGILKVRRLPAAERGKDYQLWVIDPHHATPVSGGVFTVQSDGSAMIRFAPTQRVSSATAFAVSLENAGGSTSPAGPIVLSN
jgi:anti-sigma-K factor RskA